LKKHADAIFFQPGFVPERHKSYGSQMRTAQIFVRHSLFSHRDSVAKIAPECEVIMKFMESFAIIEKENLEVIGVIQKWRESMISHRMISQKDPYGNA